MANKGLTWKSSPLPTLQTRGGLQSFPELCSGLPSFPDPELRGQQLSLKHVRWSKSHEKRVRGSRTVGEKQGGAQSHFSAVELLRIFRPVPVLGEDVVVSVS